MKPVSPVVDTVEYRLVSDFLASRDARAFHELYGHVTPYVYQFIVRMVGKNERDAQDILQEVWIRAVERLQDFRWESSLRTWVCGIAINRCRELFRQRAKSNTQLFIDDAETVSTSGSPALRLDLEEAIAHLPDGYRMVLVLHDVEGFTHEEIAAQLGIETGTSKSQLSRARQAVRRMLQDN